MKRFSLSLILLILLALNISTANADVNVTLTFPASDFTLSQKSGKGIVYDFVSLKGCSYTGSPGEPMIPVKTVYLSIPANEEPDIVIASITTTANYTITNKIYPAQYPVAANGVEKNVPFEEPNGVYSNNASYPGTNANTVHSGCLGGYKIVAVNVFPVQYKPVTQNENTA